VRFGSAEINAVLFIEIYLRYSALYNDVTVKFACARNGVVGEWTDTSTHSYLDTT